MARARTIYLHLGTHKTGSTAIQRNFARYRPQIAQHGLRYLGGEGPYTHLYSAFMPDPSRFMWNVVSGLSLEQILERDAAVVADLHAMIDTVRKPRILISNEFLSMLPPASLALLRDSFQAFGTVRAVYVYRDLHPWLSSNTQEMAKTGTATGPTDFHEALQRISRFPLKIAQVFGPDACHFLRFEEIARNGVCSGFLQALGLPDFPAMGLEESRENVSISAAATEALFAYNARHPFGDPTRDEEEVARLKALPGPSYRAPGFAAEEIAAYAEARAAVAPLGLRLADPADLPRR